MLHKEFVPYDESLELKAIGFNEPCFGYYIELRNPSEGILTIDKCENIGVSAPTYSQAFRWFRKKYNLHPAIYPIKQHWECDIRHTNKDTNSSIFSWDNEFEYEEAELACLRKLIEIVKNKENVA